MNTRTNWSYTRLVPGILAIVWCGLIPLSAQAQTGDDHATTLLARTELNAAEKSIPKTPAPPPPGSRFSWKGAYVGAHVGNGWGRASTSFAPLPTAAQFINLAPTTLRNDP